MSEESSLKRLPPRLDLQSAAVREQKAAQVRGVASIQAMREAIREVSRALPVITEVPRLGKLDGAAFRARAAEGLPFLLSGVVKRWPLCALTPQKLRERFGAVPVRARVGDYVATAFAPDRAMRDMSLREYLDLSAAPASDLPPDDLPPYVGNLDLRELNGMCHWPAYFDKMGPPRFWLGPARTVTPLHCDYDDNIFAQVWGRKRIFLAPPHHDVFLYTREANPVLFGSPFDPEAPDYDAFPLARQAAIVEVEVDPGDMLYVPAGWYHQVRALSFSLSSNRWARGVPLALQATAPA
jgi:hypothetical protein